jgi:hypothetical protein
MASLSAASPNASNPDWERAPVAKETLDQGDGIQPLALGPIDLGLTAVWGEGRSLMLVVETANDLPGGLGSWFRVTSEDPCPIGRRP